MHPPDRSLLVHRLKVALALRTRHYPVPYYRVVFGEADGLPGLVLDRYGEVLVGQIATAGMEAMRGDIEAAVEQVLAPQALVWKNDGGARELEQLPRQIITGLGKAPEEVSVIEGVLQFQAPLALGQKTGWFYDQSANRELFRRRHSCIDPARALRARAGAETAPDWRSDRRTSRSSGPAPAAPETAARPR